MLSDLVHLLSDLTSLVSPLQQTYQASLLSSYPLKDPHGKLDPQALTAVSHNSSLLYIDSSTITIYSSITTIYSNSTTVNSNSTTIHSNSTTVHSNSTTVGVVCC